MPGRVLTRTCVADRRSRRRSRSGLQCVHARRSVPAQIEVSVAARDVVHVDRAFAVDEVRRAGVGGARCASHSGSRPSTGASARCVPWSQSAPAAASHRQFALVELQDSSRLDSFDEIGRGVAAQEALVRNALTRKSRLVTTPPRCSRSRARASVRAPRARASGACAMTLASSGSKSTVTTRSSFDAALPAHRRLARRSKACSVPVAGRNPVSGSSAHSRTSMACPRRTDVLLVVAQLVALGDAQLLAHDIDAG